MRMGGVDAWCSRILGRANWCSVGVVVDGDVEMDVAVGAAMVGIVAACEM